MKYHEWKMVKQGQKPSNLTRQEYLVFSRCEYTEKKSRGIAQALEKTTLSNKEIAEVFLVTSAYVSKLNPDTVDYGSTEHISNEQLMKELEVLTVTSIAQKHNVSRAAIYRRMKLLKQK